MGNDSRPVPFHKSVARDDQQMTIRALLDAADHVVRDNRREVTPIESVQSSRWFLSTTYRRGSGAYIRSDHSDRHPRDTWSQARDRSDPEQRSVYALDRHRFRPIGHLPWSSIRTAPGFDAPLASNVYWREPPPVEPGQSSFSPDPKESILGL
jgi:hypothetical protein